MTTSLCESDHPYALLVVLSLIYDGVEVEVAQIVVGGTAGVRNVGVVVAVSPLQFVFWL